MHLFAPDIVLAARLATAIASVLSFIILMLLARRYFGYDVALTAGLIFALSNARVKISTIVWSETVFVLLIMTALMLWSSETIKFYWPKALAIGLLLCYGYMVRPEGFLFAVMLFLFSIPIHKWWSKPTFRSLLIQSGAFLLVVIVWMTYVHSITGKWEITDKAKGGITPYIISSRSKEAYQQSFILNEDNKNIIFQDQHESLPDLAKRMAHNAVDEAKWLDRAASGFILIVVILGLSLELYRKNKTFWEAVPVMLVAGLPLAYLIPLVPEWQFVYTGCAPVIILGAWQLLKRFKPDWQGAKVMGLKRIAGYSPLLIVCLYLAAMDAYTISKPLQPGDSVIYTKANWLKSVIPANTRIIDRNGNLAFYAGLNWLCLPNNDINQIIKYAKFHDVGYVVFTSEIWHYNKGWGSQIQQSI